MGGRRLNIDDATRRRIRQRAEAGVSANAIAMAMGISRSTVQAILAEGTAYGRLAPTGRERVHDIAAAEAAKAPDAGLAALLEAYADNLAAEGRTQAPPAMREAARRLRRAPAATEPAR